MSDENREMESGITGSEVLPSVGSQLKAARERKQMSVGDIAMALKLGSRQVEALESGNWQGLPGQTFIRGFVRNYARLLQVDPTPLMSQLDAVLESPNQRLTLPGQEMRQVTMPDAGRAGRRDYAMALSGLALVAVAVGIYFLLPSDLSAVREGLDSVLAIFSKKDEAAAPASPATGPEPVFPPGTTPQQVMNPQAAVPAEPESRTPETAAPPAAPAGLVPPPVVQEAAPAPSKSPAPAPQASAPVGASAATTPAPATPQAAPSAPTASATPALHFVFEKESWVEVRDRHGKVLLSQVGRPGTEKDVEGDAPFSLVLGNAPGVKLNLRGQSVDLGSRTQGNVARLKLE